MLMRTTLPVLSGRGFSLATATGTFNRRRRLFLGQEFVPTMLAAKEKSLAIPLATRCLILIHRHAANWISLHRFIRLSSVLTQTDPFTYTACDVIWKPSRACDIAGSAGNHYRPFMAKAEDALIENLDAFVAFARKRMGDPDLAADVVQDSLLKALESPDKPDDSQGAVTWFYRILRNSIIDLLRRRDVQARAIKRLKTELPDSPDADAEQVVCQCVKRLLPGLPEQYRDLLQRIDLDGESPKAAAASLGLTTNNLNVRLHRARQRLRQKVEATCRVCSKHGCLDCSCGNDAAR